MTSVPLKNLEGKTVGEVLLNTDVFELNANPTVLHSALVRQLANARAGTASTKTRAEVRGGGRKPRRQKGTGHARVGSIRSPLWVGGGVIFGPKPRSYASLLPQKVRQLALRSALTAKKDSLVVVKSFEDLFAETQNLAGVAHKANQLTQPKTKAMYAALKNLGIANHKILFVLTPDLLNYQQIERAARNIHSVKVINTNNLNVKDLLDFEVVLTTESAIQVINNQFKIASKPAISQPTSQHPRNKRVSVQDTHTKVSSESQKVHKQPTPEAGVVELHVSQPKIETQEADTDTVTKKARTKNSTTTKAKVVDDRKHDSKPKAKPALKKENSSKTKALPEKDKSSSATKKKSKDD